jgi:nucleotide-binding universal stress UspA family protein
MNSMERPTRHRFKKILLFVTRYWQSNPTGFARRSNLSQHEKYAREKAMKLLERILIATDFSPGADDALATGALVAKQFDSEVTLLHVMVGTVDFCSQYATVVRAKVKERLEEHATRIRAAGIESVDTVVGNGVAFDEITQQAAARDVNVIFIGACQRSKDDVISVGTTAARLRRKAVRPVWMVKPGSAPRLTQVLCPIDSSKASGRALRNAIHVARGCHAELTVLTVAADSSTYYEGLGDIDADLPETSSQRAPAQFDRFLREHDFYDVNWKRTVRQGDPAREILKVARETQSDLLVMGSVGRTGLTRILIGGVARKVARQMPCSIITVRSEPVIKLHLDAEIADIHARLKQGLELLERGFAQEALAEFQQCIAKDMLFAPAWEGLAAAHEHLGHPEEAQKCDAQAAQITRKLWNSQSDT